MEKFSAVIPTLNEEENIGEVIDGIREHGDPEIIVVDDDSSDGTRQLAARKGAKVIHRKALRDRSKSIVDGLKQASNDYVVVMDGDGQHPADRIPDAVEGLEEAGLFVMSRREVRGEWGAHRRLISFGAEKIVKTLFPACRRVIDPLSGFFGVRKTLLEFDRLRPRGYEALIEILVTQDLEIGESTYVFRQREGGKSALGPRVMLDFILHLADLAFRKLKS